MTRILLDWSGRGNAPEAKVGPLQPCRICRHPALLRDPRTGTPCHKVCAEAELSRQADTLATEHAA